MEVSDRGNTASKSGKASTNSPTVPDFRKSSVEAESSVKAKYFSTTPIRRSVSQYASCFGCRWSEERKIFVEHGGYVQLTQSSRKVDVAAWHL